MCVSVQSRVYGEEQDLGYCRVRVQGCLQGQDSGLTAGSGLTVGSGLTTKSGFWDDCMVRVACRVRVDRRVRISG